MIKQLSTKIVYENKFMKVHEDQVEFPTGQTGLYAVIDKLDYSLIIPYENGHFYLVKQYRYPLKKESWEFPAGRTEGKDLPAEQVAKNELHEETGLLAGTMKKVGFLYAGPGGMHFGAHIFLATDLRQDKQSLDESESGLSVHKISLEKFEEMIRTGEIAESPTVSAYGLLKLKNLLPI